MFCDLKDFNIINEIIKFGEYFMEKIKLFINEITERYRKSLRRFLVSDIVVIALGLFIIGEIILEFKDSFFSNIVLSGIMALLFSLVISLKKNNTLLSGIVSIIVFVIWYLILHNYLDEVYVMLSYAGLCIGLIAVIIHLLLSYNQKRIVGYLIYNLLYVGLLCSIIYLGLCICIAGFQFLVYATRNSEKIYLIFFVLIEVILNITLFISYLPEKNDDISYPKAYSLLFHKVTISLYYLLLVILYLYLFKILFTWTMPVGRINWFASFALLFYCYFLLSCNDEDYFLCRFHIEYGAIALLPVFLVQQLSIFIRINAYGLTVLRMLSLIFNLIGLAFIISSFFKKERKVFLFVAATAIIFTFVPYVNIIDFPALMQQNRLIKVLNKNEMLQGNTIVYKNTISASDKEDIISASDYLISCDSQRLKMMFKGEYRNANLDVLNKISNNYDPHYFDTEYCYYYSHQKTFDIRGYEELVYTMFGEVDLKQLNQDRLKDYCRNLYRTYGNSCDLTEELRYDESNQTIIFRHINFMINGDDEVSDIYFEGFILKKAVAPID